MSQQPTTNNSPTLGSNNVPRPYIPHFLLSNENLEFVKAQTREIREERGALRALRGTLRNVRRRLLADRVNFRAPSARHRSEIYAARTFRESENTRRIEGIIEKDKKLRSTIEDGVRSFIIDPGVIDAQLDDAGLSLQAAELLRAYTALWSAEDDMAIELKEMDWFIREELVLAPPPEEPILEMGWINPYGELMLE